MGLSPYCIWGLCDSREYCCGDNVCCSGSDFNYLLLTATILGTIIILGLCCACFYGSCQRVWPPLLKRYLKISYTLMFTQKEKRTSPSANKDSTMTESVVQIKETTAIL
ncbi:hypothetical protein ANTQUA_LOCUS9512 [Anthophora quadrimaculata]